MTKYDISHMHTILIQFPIGLNTQTNKINLLVSTILKMVTQVSIKSGKSPFCIIIDYWICPSLVWYDITISSQISGKLGFGSRLHCVLLESSTLTISNYVPQSMANLIAIWYGNVFIPGEINIDV